MDRIRRLWKGEEEEQAYEPLENSITAAEREDGTNTLENNKPGFSWLEYGVFLLLGISMLWAWNMFLAAGPYFQHRFRENDWISENFQAAELAVSTITNLGSMLILTRMQAGASYPKRIISSLFINMAIFALLAASTVIDVGAKGYFAFLMLMVFATSLATGLCQNGIFAYVSGFGQPQYTQGIMTGQGVAGVLPCIAQIVSVLSVQSPKDVPPPSEGVPSPGPAPGPQPVKSSAALAYFLTATIISVATLFAFSYLATRHRQTPPKLLTTDPDTADEPQPERKQVSMTVLFRKLFWLASAVFIVFAVTMLYPVFTQRIVSVCPPTDQPAYLQPASFIPLAFLFWNIGDLVGRLLTAMPALSLIHRPQIVLLLAALRIAWIGLYHLCNVRGQGAVVDSDLFYLVVVQMLFGLTNGYLGSTCMIGAAEWVDPEEREAAGGFMGLCLVAGLAVGSLASFFVAGA
jgi:equilibrative nucleoside transporter 1/2/3